MHTHRYVAAVELLGERDEALEELRADLMDVKNLYRGVCVCVVCRGCAAGCHVAAGGLWTSPPSMDPVQVQVLARVLLAIKKPGVR